MSRDASAQKVRERRRASVLDIAKSHSRRSFLPADLGSPQSVLQNLSIERRNELS